MTRLRIALVTPEYPPLPGGVSRYVEQLARQLAGLGHEVRVLCCTNRVAPGDTDDGGVRVHFRRPVRLAGFRRLTRLSWTLERLELAAAVRWSSRPLLRDVDVVDTPSWGAGSLLAPRRSRVLVVTAVTPVTLAEPGRSRWERLDRRIADRLERRAAARADLVVADSSLHLERLRDLGWALPDVAVGWLPVEATDSAPIADDDPVVLQVGRLEPRKRPELLVDALASLARSGTPARAVFAGIDGRHPSGGLYSDFLRNRARELGVEIEVLGVVDDAHLGALYRRARVVAQLSTYESFGLSASEGLAAGRPVLVSDQSGLAEVLGTAGQEFVVIDDRPAHVAARLAPWIEDPRAAAAAGSRGRAIVTALLDGGLLARDRVRLYTTYIDRQNGNKRPRRKS